MISFDDMLKQLHDNGASLSDDENSSPIVVTPTRKFEVPEGYNTILAYAGDVNSQIVTFALPQFHEGHDMSKCEFKKLYWKNSTSGIEDTSDLVLKSTEGNNQILEWVFPPAAATEAGKIEIKITLYDLVDGKVAFSWNTPIFSQFTVGDTFTKVGERITQSNLPKVAKDDILFIDEESRAIVAPRNYNYIVGNYGDVGTSFVYFQTLRKIRGIDLLDEGTTIDIAVTLKDKAATYTIAKNDIETRFAEGSRGEELIDFVWWVPPEITNNASQYIGAFTIKVVVTTTTKRWLTSDFTKLQIGGSLIRTEQDIFRQETQTIIDGAQWQQELASNTIGGIYLLREDKPGTVIKKGELIISFDEEGAVEGIAIGDAEKPIEEAPVVKIVPPIGEENKEEIVAAVLEALPYYDGRITVV